MKSITSRTLVDKNSCRLVDGSLIGSKPIAVEEIREAKEFAEVHRLVYGAAPTLETVIYETRVQRQEAQGRY